MVSAIQGGLQLPEWAEGGRRLLVFMPASATQVLPLQAYTATLCLDVQMLLAVFRSSVCHHMYCLCLTF